MKPKSNKQRNYDLDDVAVMDLSSEFDEVIGNDFDYIDLDAKADVDYDEDDLYY